MILFKDETADFNNNIANTDNFKSSKYKFKLLENTVDKRYKIICSWSKFISKRQSKTIKTY